MHSRETKGDNALHTIISTGTFEEIKSFIENYSDKTELTRLALSLNDQGELPIDVVFWATSLKKRESFMVSTLIAEIMNKKQIKPLVELVDFHEICNRFSITPDSIHYETIHDACIVVNEIRKKVVYSETHPNGPTDTTTKFEDGTFQSELKQKKYQLMAEAGQYIDHFFTKGKNDHYRLITDDENYIAILYYIDAQKCDQLLEKVTRASDAGLAKCIDMAYDAHKIFSRLQKDKPIEKRLHGEVIGFRPGDHAFYLAGRNLATDFKDQESWLGKGLTVIDAWSGNIFPATKETIKEYLCDYQETRYAGKCLPHFNPAYHKFESPLLNIHPNHFHIVYLSKETAKDEKKWEEFLQSCKDSNSRYLSPEKILSKEEWDTYRHRLPGPITSFHFPIDETIPMIDQEWKFIRLFFETKFVDKPPMTIQKTDYFKESITSDITKAELSKLCFNTAAQLFQPHSSSTVNSYQTLIQRQNNIDNYIAKLQEIGSNDSLALPKKREEAFNQYEKIFGTQKLTAESVMHIKFKIESIASNSNMQYLKDDPSILGTIFDKMNEPAHDKNKCIIS